VVRRVKMAYLGLASNAPLRHANRGPSISRAGLFDEASDAARVKLLRAQRRAHRVRDRETSYRKNVGH
jgi:hypothetical protein